MLSSSLTTSASALLVSLLASPALAQLHTDCNPMLKDCPADPAFGTAHTFNFNSTPATGLWNVSAGTVNYDAETGAAFTINAKGYSPTLTSNFYFFWGRTEVIMKAANGTGIISSIVYGSDDLDEVDWEFRGVDTNSAQSNYYGKGVTASSVGATHNVTGNIQTEWHNYTNVWTAEKLEWWIDGTLARTLTPAMANSSHYYPQTPMKLMLGIWAGGDSGQSAGTIEWAGGATDYDAGPYTMYIKSARVEDYSSGTEYSYGDRTGNSSSIKITKEEGTNSTAVDNLNAAADDTEDDESISEKWAALSSSTKTGIYAGAAGVGAIMIAALLFYYFKQRKRGHEEAALAAKNQERDRVELEQFKKEGRDPDALAYEGADYDASSMRKNGLVSTASYSVPSDDYDRSNSLHNTQNTPAWDPTTSGMISPGAGRPLLQDNGSGFNGPSRSQSFGPAAGQSPGYTSPAVRNMSTPNPSMRMGSPGPQGGGYGNIDRVGSPASFRQPQNRGYGNGDDGYFGSGNGYR